MGKKVDFTEEDMARSRVVDKPYWIPCEVGKLKEKAAGTDGSDLYVYPLKALDGDYKGTTFFAQFSAKAMGMMVPFAKACGAVVDPKKGLKGYDLDHPTGKKINVKVKPGEWEGKSKNEVTDYRPLGVTTEPIKTEVKA